MINSVSECYIVRKLLYNISRKTVHRKYTTDPVCNIYASLYMIYKNKYNACPDNSYIGISEVCLS